jgi:hypothetical protein
MISSAAWLILPCSFVISRIGAQTSSALRNRAVPFGHLRTALQSVFGGFCIIVDSSAHASS